jgi:methyl-accepting chemotaxis protein
LFYFGAPLLIISIVLFLPLVLKLNTFEMSSSEAYDSARQLLYLHDRFWLPVTLCVAAVALHSLYVTQKIAGPLYRFRKTFASVQKGLLPRTLRLRRRDLLGPELQGLNAMLQALRHTVEQTQEDAATLDRLISRHREIHREADPESERILAEMTSVIKRLHSNSCSIQLEE